MVNCCKIVKPECVVPENIHTLPPPPPHFPTESNGNSEGRRGAKGGNFRGGGVASSVFFPGAPSKIDEQAISCFTVNRCFKQVSPQKFLFSSMIFYWRSAEFFTACTIVHVNRLPSAHELTSGYLSVALLYNILWYSM